MYVFNFKCRLVYFVGNKLAPILIERKSIDDLAGSLVDGRWESQQRNMRKAQYVLGKGEQRWCQICYIVEGEAGKRVVHGGAVARTSWDVVRLSYVYMCL
jgi:ERCC4-type nuclease